MRAIDADRLITDRMKEHYYHLPNGDIAIPIIDIEHAPTIVPERKRGRWRRKLVDSGFNADWYCSECGWKTILEEHGYNYCPNCGADMRGEQNEAD